MAAHNAKSRRSGQALSKAVEPASSLIAAHLAPHLASGAHGNYGIERETFSQLRQEILGQPELDDNLNDIHTLVCVVVRAGLEPLLKGRNGNALRDDVFGQVTDCLDIVYLAIQKAPQVLHEPCDPGVLAPDTGHAPLFAWIIPLHLSLLCSWDNKTVREKSSRVLSTIYTAQFKLSKSWHSSRSIVWFFRACIIG